MINTVCNFCKKEYIYKGGISHFNRVKNHYCSITCQQNGNKKHGMCGRNGNKDKRYKIWENALKRAKLKNILFTIFPEDIPHIPEYCPVLKIKIQENNKSGPIDSSPSLDRIKPSLGYVKNNIRIISNRANRLKSNGLTDEFYLLYLDSLSLDNVHLQHEDGKSEIQPETDNETP